LLQALFSKFGTVVATTVRRRRETGKDGEMKVSWALISFAEAREAKEAVAGAASLGCARRHRFLTCVCMLRICLERVVTKCLHISLRNLLPRRYKDVVARSFDMEQAMASKGSMADIARRHQSKEEQSKSPRSGAGSPRSR
jgi:hypothetical protein